MPEKFTLRQLKARSTTLAVSLTIEERQKVVMATDLEGESISGFIRDAAVKKAERVIAKERKRAA